jgi:hypothetical protein
MGRDPHQQVPHSIHVREINRAVIQWWPPVMEALTLSLATLHDVCRVLAALAVAPRGSPLSSWPARIGSASTINAR